MRANLLPLLCLLAAPLAAQNLGLTLQNGTIMHVDVPFAPALVPRSGVTVEAWVTYDSSTLGSGWRFPTIVRSDPSANQASFFLRVEAGQTRTDTMLWWVSTTSGDYTLRWNFQAGSLLTWTHVAATYDGATLRLFVNGSQVAQGTGTGAILNRSGGFRIGNGDLTVAGGETWNGQIDEVRVWPFARDAAAIQSTQQLQLALMPGEVSTWNLNGDGRDSSGGNHGTTVGPLTFTANTLTLRPIAFGGVNYGTASGCIANGVAAITAPATSGNPGFGVSGHRVPPNANGLCWITIGRLAAPMRYLGVDFWISIVTPALLVPVQSGALGGSVLGLPIPSDPSMIGWTLYAQSFWVDAACSPAQLSATSGVGFPIQP